MAKLFSGFFKQIEKPQSVHPPSVSQEFSQHDSEYIAYCIEQEQAISKLEAGLHTNDEPELIAKKSLATACEFYGADWAGIIELDLELNIWTNGWWHNTDPQIKSLQKLQEFENLMVMPSIVEAIKKQKPIIIADIEDIARSSPKEYQVYKRLDVNSVMAVPFGPKPMGFLAIRNPKKYMNRTSTLNTLAYVIHRAIAQKNTMDRVRMALSPDEIKTDNDIIINFFGSMEITTPAGVWKEQDFNSPKSSRAVAYILLQSKIAHSALAIADALYPEDGADVDIINKNIRGYIYRFRKSFEPICKHKLIEYTPNGYKLNPSLNVMTDLQKFERLWKQAQQDIPIPQKVHTLKHAIKLYRGHVLGSACDDHWLVGIATDYKMKYITLVNELLSIFAEFEDYDAVHHFATKALKLVPENVKAQYWLVYAIYHSGVIALAKKEMFGVEGTDNLHFAVYAKQLGAGLDEQLEKFIREHPDTRLIIIDTLQKIREVSTDAYSYANDYDIVGKMKQFADKHGICLLLVHHTRKQQAGDRFEMISGTTGLLGCADGAFILQKEKRTDLHATLEIVGRDQPDQKLHLTRDEEKLIWLLDHTETELWKQPPDPLLDKIAAVITDENPVWNGSATELVALLSEDLQPNILTRRLNVKAGELRSEYGIEYTMKRTRNGSSISLMRKAL